MKIIILNGNPSVENAKFDCYLINLKNLLEDKNHEARVITLRDYQLRDCIGCYSCWLKNPGICCLKDGIDEILREYLSADVVVSASPVLMGYISALLKRVNDRMLPLMHPFLKLKGNRMSHFLRYSHYPKPVLLLDSIENSKYIQRVYEHSERGIPEILSTNKAVEEICDEIINS